MNESVIVDADGYVKATKMGKIWADTGGEVHGDQMMEFKDGMV